ncbi:RagB/SusD family nutrient uptake outer membrane protein [Parapedobacter sp. DT-150]|uniref:RagB/SusD family nutrient uptake outer membrane protein n=1 Tax=Parapedobacter sp. DT-150 TaxID=3396162 RepID=UPI003F1964C3
MKIFNLKKSTILTGVSLCLGLTFTSCNEDFLNVTPLSRVTPETIFATTDNAYAAINGMHRYMYSQWYRQAEGGQSGNMIYMDALGEDFVMTGQANGWFITEYKWLAHRDVNSAMLRFNYGFYYAMIGNANAILTEVDGAVGPDADKNFLKAQALTYRAWSYFQMIQLFGERYVNGGSNSGLGLSIVLEQPTEPVSRSSVEEVYAQIHADLDQAISLYEAAGIERPDISHLNEDVAMGLKARVYLTQQNYALAAEFAHEARQDYPLMSRTEYTAGFSDFTNEEWMWGVRHREDQPNYFYSFFAYLGNYSSTNTRGNPKAINSKLYEMISETDIRKQLWDPTGADPDFPLADGGAREPYMNRKFLLDNPANSNGDLVFMRAAEMYLIEAEALANMDGRDADAADVLYELASARDTEYERSANAGQALIDEILTQRRIELWGEGFRFYDLKRLNMPLDRTGANHNVTLAVKMTEPAGTSNWVFLIPQEEINYSQGIVQQNPL